MVQNAYDINPKIDRDEEFLSKQGNIKLILRRLQSNE